MILYLYIILKKSIIFQKFVFINISFSRVFQMPHVFQISLSLIRFDQDQFLILLSIINYIINNMTDICKQLKAYDSMSEASTQGDDLTIMSSIPNSKKQQNPKNTKAKSSLCRNYSQKGYCPYGYKCQFAHGVQELRCKMEENSYKTKTCNAFSKKGYCKYGFRCNFLHQQTKEIQKKEALQSFRELIYQSKNKNESHLSFAKKN